MDTKTPSDLAKDSSSSFKHYRKKEYVDLLLDANVKRWYNNMAKTSVVHADITLRRLGSFLREVNLTPSQYAKLSVEKMENLAIDFVDDLAVRKNQESGKPYAPIYIDSHLKAIRSWAEWNRKRFQRRIKIANLNRRPSLENERIPTVEELRRVLYAATTPLRTRVSIALMAFSGPRPESQGNYLGLDGLRISDFPELKIKEHMVSFEKIPTVLIVREEISKTRHQYITFLGEEGCDILRDYLQDRLSHGEALLPESPIISTSAKQAKRRSGLDHDIKDTSPFLTTTKIGDRVRKAMRAVGLPWRPYVFRSYFDTNLMVAVNKQFASHAYQQFWMGHKGDIESVYTVNKRQLPESVVDDMRASYTKVASELLETSKKKSGMTQDEVQAFINRKILSVARITQAEIGALGKDPSQLTDQEIDDLIQRKQKAQLGLNGNGNQQIVPFKDVKNWIAQGWEYVRDFPPDEAIIGLPGH